MTDKHDRRTAVEDNAALIQTAVANISYFSNSYDQRVFDASVTPEWQARFKEAHEVEETLPPAFHGFLGLFDTKHGADIRSDFGPNFWGPATPITNLLTSEFLAAASLCSKKQPQPSEHELRKRFPDGLRRGIIPAALCYEALGLAPKHPVTESVFDALQSRGHTIDITQGIPSGLAQHYAEVIPRPEYPMRAVTSDAIENYADFLEPLIHERIIVEWGPGDGTHLANLVRKCGKPALVVLVDRSQSNLNESRIKLMEAGMDNDRIVTICDDFYTPDLFTKHKIFKLVQNSGIAITNIIFGGTLWNYTEALRVPFLSKLYDFCEKPPQNGGQHAMLATNDWTQDRETNWRAYFSKAYEKFYYLGCVWGCITSNLRVNLTHLHIDVRFNPKGLEVGLVNTKQQFVSLNTDPESTNRFSTDAPRYKHSYELKVGQFLRVTLAERPTPIVSTAEFLSTKWKKVTLKGRDRWEHTLPHRDPYNPLAKTGLNVFYPAPV